MMFLGLLLAYLLVACVVWGLILSLVPTLEATVLDHNAAVSMALFVLYIVFFNYGDVLRFDTYTELIFIYVRVCHAPWD